ncbi:DUF480 domain-containing protein [Arsenicicoccus piscis]|uniref:Methyltransferase domain-containing protein n=1 Tax=Arsenicicoccus piscis TaxID=673954 RepID=A0ABQ6HN23_9MICO|nr:DUF480 domain-containing protein [Arsenicicoccus piscis]MCH8627059.1 DUF480 domain-containing protein [Arsenicicoccus piscis]GMA19005.1 hypothetical protein GCM10025862_10260 [Arsenicicoccus piscis]
MHSLQLDDVDQRVLGSLMEKQRTVPESYPLSLNAVRSACNQKSSRSPVVDYDETMLEERLQDLKHRGLVRVVWAGKGSRTLKYHQLLTESLDLGDAESALLTVLLLRGPQSAGELRTRTERLHEFGDRQAVEQVLGELAAADPPLVRELARRPGERDPRYVHLLGAAPVEQPDSPEAADVDDRERPLAEGAAARDERVRQGYSVVAQAYAEANADELGRLPFDAWVLGRVARLAGDDPVVEVGCGDGHLTAYLAAAGADVTGLDLAPGMVEHAQRTYPDLTFTVGDLTRLMRPPTAPAWGAIVAWHSLIHLAASELAPAIGALGGVLRPGGWLALTVPVGRRVRTVGGRWGHEGVEVLLVEHDPAQVLAAVEAAGLQVRERYVRGPVPGVEPDADRLTVLAQRPEDA